MYTCIVYRLFTGDEHGWISVDYLPSSLSKLGLEWGGRRSSSTLASHECVHVQCETMLKDVDKLYVRNTKG